MTKLKRKTRKNIGCFLSLIMGLYALALNGVAISQTGQTGWTRQTLSNSGLLLAANPFKYSGYYQDFESKLYYLKARYYSPKLERFISRDTYDLSNHHAYCDGNPIGNADPSGHSSDVARLIGEGLSLASMFSTPCFAASLAWDCANGDTANALAGILLLALCGAGAAYMLGGREAIGGAAGAGARGGTLSASRVVELVEAPGAAGIGPADEITFVKHGDGLSVMMPTLTLSLVDRIKLLEKDLNPDSESNCLDLAISACVEDGNYFNRDALKKLFAKRTRDSACEHETRILGSEEALSYLKEVFPGASCYEETKKVGEIFNDPCRRSSLIYCSDPDRKEAHLFYLKRGSERIIGYECKREGHVILRDDSDVKLYRDRWDSLWRFEFGPDPLS